MDIYSLDGEWQLYGFEEGSQKVTHPNDLSRLGIVGLPGRVPGNPELDWQHAGKIAEPFFGSNVNQLRAYEGFEWWYLKQFHLPGGKQVQAWSLVCEGLDTLATVWVNGKKVGEADNALIEQVFEVTEALKPGEENTIAIRLRSAVKDARRYEYDANVKSWELREEGLFLRRPAHSWGWDIMPRVVSPGIWRSIQLVERQAEAIEQLYFWTVAVEPGREALGVRFQCRTQSLNLEGVHLSFEGQCGDHTFNFDWPLEFIAGGCQISIPDARLWWPKGYGEPSLYRVNVRLMRGEDVLDERQEKVGLRKIEVNRTSTSGSPAFHWNSSFPTRVDTPPDPDHHFVFSINNEPVMIKGTNWVPLDAFHSRDAERLPAAIALADDVGVNMIRCWGGNVYESDAFFDLCDEKGILVWQDFAFACCRYPQTDDFLAQVRHEAEFAVRRLRNHPSLAVWCGDNEIDQVYLSDGLSPEFNRISREILPQVVHRLDPLRAYIPSSPYISPEAFKSENPFIKTSEQHLWGPRGYFKSRFYSQHGAHFIGEIGYHGCPNPASIRRFISPEKVWPWQDNDEWLVHSVNHWANAAVQRDRITLMANQVKELFGSIPEDLETFALASQITQAEAKKYFIESTRLRKWQTSGLLWWNLIDGWPQFSDAVVDYYYEKKLAYHYIRRVQQPVCLVIGEETELRLPVVICNDSRREVDVQYRVWEAGSDDSLLEGSFHGLPNQNWCLGAVRSYASDQRVLLMQWQVDGVSYGNHALLAAPPVNLEKYRAWLKIIAALPRRFEI